MKAILYLHNYERNFDMHNYVPDFNLSRYELNLKLELGRQFRTEFW